MAPELSGNNFKKMRKSRSRSLTKDGSSLLDEANVLFIGDEVDELMSESFHQIGAIDFETSRKFEEVRLSDADITLDGEHEDKFYSTPYEQYITQKMLHKKLKSSKKDKIVLEEVNSEVPAHSSKDHEPLFFKEKRDELESARMFEWLHNVRCGNNLLFYGVGSKIHTLNQLVYCLKERDKNGFFVIVCGFNPSVTIDMILDQILKQYLKESDKNIKSLSSIEKVDAIGLAMNQNIESYEDDEYGEFADFVNMKSSENVISRNQLYICIHNMDGESLKSRSCQQLLAVLASYKNIQFICSVDHHYSNLLWDNTIEDKFGFIRYNITNFCTYFMESEYISLQELLEESSSSDANKDKAVLGPVEIAYNILKSANKKHKQVYIVICKKFVENEKKAQNEKSATSLGCTYMEIKNEMGTYAIDDGLLRDGLAYLENQIMMIKKKQHTYIPALKRSQCEKLLAMLQP